MSCKDDGMCKTAAICFLDGCQAEKCTTATTERTNLSHRNHVGAGLRLAEARKDARVASAVAFASANQHPAPEAPATEQQAATTASAHPGCGHCNNPLFAGTRCDCGKVFSRAADGQQGASRAALDDEQIEAMFKAAGGRWQDSSYWVIEDPDLHPFVRSLARNLPAQGAAQVEVEAARDEVLEEAAKVCEAQATEYFPMTAKGLADAIRALKSDCAAQSRAQSDTTGDRNAS